MNTLFHISLVGLLCLAPALHAASEPDVRRDATVLAVEKVMPSVVYIATETITEYHDLYTEIWRRFYGLDEGPARQQHNIGLGSGVIIDDEGYILTNFHVVRRANRIQVKLSDGREYDADPWVYTEATDIAVLKLRAKPGDKFKAIQLAPDDDLLLGETVLALGNPYGLGVSVTKGILSSKNRRRSNQSEPLNIEDWLQTDAAINPGNSGGPLVNLRGELIGVNVAVYREESGQRGVGVGFAIPVKQVSAAIARYSAPEMTESLWFGALFKAGAGPLVVQSLQPGSPAARAGLRVGDELLQVNGHPTRSLIGANRLIGEAEDHKASLLVRRGALRDSFSVQLMPLEDLIRQKLGLVLLDLPAGTAARLGLQSGSALYIDQVEKGGPADSAQLKRGFVLTGIDGQDSAPLRAVAEIVGRKPPGDSVQLNVLAPRRLGGFLTVERTSFEVRLR